jgi:integrase
VGVLKIRGKWGYELYDENGKRVRKVVEKKDGPKPKEGWHEVTKKAHRNACGARDKGEPLPFTTSRKTFREIAKKYFEVCTPTWTPAEAIRVRGMLDNHMLPFLGARPIARIRQLDIETYVAQRRAEFVKKPCKIHQQGERCPTCDRRTSPTTANKEIARLHHLFSKAIQWGEVHRNPCQGVKKFREPGERIAFLEPEQRARRLAVCEEFSPVLCAVVIVAMLTGGRLSEILALTWGNLDLRRRILTFRKTKSGKVRHVPINADLLAVLRHLEPAADPASSVFPAEWNKGRISVAFSRCATSAAARVCHAGCLSAA